MVALLHHARGRLVVAAVAAVALGGCGGTGPAGTNAGGGTRPSAASGTASQPGDLRAPATSSPPAVNELGAAERPTSSLFPSPAGRSLAQLAKLVGGTATLGPANATFTPGSRRFAFALTDPAQRFIYAPTAIYLAATPSSPAEGPFLAPADPMPVPGPYRSEQYEGPGGLQAIYFTELPVPRSGVFDLLSLTRVGPRLIGATGEIAAALSTPIPDLGQRPPAISTETLATAHGNVGLLTTRRPPENMHAVSFNQVLGRRPIALLFSTPELCTSRVCGPVTDIMVELQRQFGASVTFLHQEVYVDNNPAKGLRPQLRAFHLETEPWLFTINRLGIITARLEGAFGVVEARRAVEEALG
jgi:hypothetical protein